MTAAADDAVAVAMPPDAVVVAMQDEDKNNNDNSDDDGCGAKPPPVPPPPPQPPRYYGADGLTPRQFALIQLALVIGSSIEWFDFSVYGALSTVITPLFFPTSAGGATSGLYFWGVFALSFVTRPIGSLLLGSVGDRWGRRPALLISLAGMAIPTVLIGCLPTYAMVGVAAPILLALLRAIQGLAMGAEFSSAMVYSVELAPSHKKGVFGSLTFQAAVWGIAIGNACVMVLTAFLSAEQMRVWGWRLPFLATAVSALGAFALRIHMPEPRAWEEAAVCAAEDEEGEEGAVEAQEKKKNANDDNDSCSDGLPTVAAAPATAASSSSPAGSSSKRRNNPNKARRRRRRRRTTPARHTEGVPALKLLRHSWPQVALQTLFEAFGSVAFYVFALWLPSWHQSSGLMSAEAASGATIAALAFMAGTSILGGWASDACQTPRRRLAAASAAVAAGTAIVIPGFLSVAGRAAAGATSGGGSGGSQAAAALFQLGELALAGFALGIVPSLCAELYAADVRVVSFSLAHNLSMSLLGGTAPLVISAMAGTPAGRSGAAPGVYVAAAGGASLLAAAALAAGARALFVAAPSAPASASASASFAGENKVVEEEEAPRVAVAFV